MDIYNERKEKLLAFINDENYRGMKAKDIAMLLSIQAEDMQMLYDMLAELELDGKVIKTKKNKYFPAEKAGLYSGIFIGNSRGFGFVEINKDDKDIFIPYDKVNGAIHKDKVLCKIYDANASKPEGEIVKVLERGIKRIVGTYQQVKNYGFVIPDEKKIADDIFIKSGDGKGAVTGQKVTVKITVPADEKHKNPEGVVDEILGHINDPGVDILSIIMQYDLPVEFPEKVYREIETIEDTIENEDISNREDYRNVTMVTIDGEDAKDLDDAVSVEKLENGNYKLGVYIADVSHYVRFNSPLDKEAYKRGTSVYLVDRVIPMLPHKLSNGICSLNAGVDRFSLCCIMEINENGDVVSSEIKKAVINVDSRMSYTIVNDLLTNDNSEYADTYKHLMPMFKNMECLRNILFNKRIKRGAIEFNSDEAKIILDDNGKPIDIVKRERNIATSIIEEFMLAANETVAEYFYWIEIPFVYRTHDEPDEEKYEKLQDYVGKLGYVLKGSSKHPKTYQTLLQSISDTPEEPVVQKMALRSMKQARYTSENGNHFGLAAKYYCHFTSPIRRYPDLQIHRIISDYLAGTLDERKISYYRKNLTEISTHCSITERTAEEAERETDKYKIVEFMKDKVGQEFSGIISGITSWGIYVELPNTVEGMVSIKDLYDDIYEYDEDNLRYIGIHTGRTYNIGDKVNVVLIRASIEARTLDFEFN